MLGGCSNVTEDDVAKPLVDDRVCLAGILFVLKTRIAWEDFPCEMNGKRGRERDWMRPSFCPVPVSAPAMDRPGGTGLVDREVIERPAGHGMLVRSAGEKADWRLPPYW